MRIHFFCTDLKSTSVGTVPYTFKHCMKIVASPDSNVMSVNTPGQIESGIIAKHIFSYRVHLQVLKELNSKMYIKVLCLRLLHIAIVGRVL